MTPSEDTTFTTVEAYARGAVSYLKGHGISRLDALYGVSMGGAAAMYLLAAQLLPISGMDLPPDLSAGLLPDPAWNHEHAGAEKVSLPEEWTPEGVDQGGTL